MTEASIFAAALDKANPEERAAYLAEACVGDDRLRRRVEALLRAHAESDDLLDPPAVPKPTVDYAPLVEQPGTRIGPYKLMEQIGEGGFGLVFVAEQQEPVRRKVALKIIKPGMDSHQVIARFEAERQALALMDHPNIARVFDAGATDSGRPYFVMELVRGIPITDYCDQNQLTPRERLELFVTVCNAIQHAHQKGVIHRDLKPSNVLVTSHDGKPVAKVIDFGVAKAIHQHLTERTIYTHFAQMIGTPLYMSPEQAEMSGLDIDTRSDIYSLGVLLYELLTGTTPLEKQRFAQAAYDEIRRLIREEEPLRPSQRLSTSDTLPSLAASRKTEPAKLSKLLRGEVDWIVMKALEKDRTRRYETANGFAKDIERYLANEPVEACPPSTGYRLRKFVRRNRTGVIYAAGIFAAALLALAGQTVNLIQARRAEANALAAVEREYEARQREAEQRDQAVAERDAKEMARQAEAEARRRATAVADLLESIFFGLSPRVGVEEFQTEMARHLEEVEAKLAKDGDAVDPLVRARLRFALGHAHGGLGNMTKALTLFQQAVDERRTHLGADHPDTLLGMSCLGDALRANGQLDRARSLLEEVNAKLKTRPDATAQLRLGALNHLALVYVDALQFAQARPLLEKALAELNAEVGPEHPLTILTTVNLGDTLRYLGETAKGTALLEQGLEKMKQHLGPDSSLTLLTANNLATAYEAQGQLDKTKLLLEETLQKMNARLGPEHPQTLACRGNLGMVWLELGDTKKAATLLTEAVKHLETKIGLTPRTAALKHNLEGLPQLKPDADRYWQLLTDRGAKHRDTLRARLAFAATLRRLGGVSAADYHDRAVRASLADLEKVVSLHSSDPVAAAADGFFLAMANWQLGDREKARTWFDKSVAWMEKGAKDDAELKRFRAEVAKTLGIK